MEIGDFNYLSALYEEQWRACAGPLIHLPQVGERVFYFPQGHLEQVAALTNEKSNEKLPIYDLPSKILCRVVNIELRAAETHEVYAQITLFPEYSQDDVDEPDPLLPERPKPVVKSIYKTLTATDINNKLHVRQHDANECFPPLDMTQKTPSQELVAIDLHGFSWHFKHAFTGNPKRHVLTTGWKRFVTKKRLVSGDSIIFIRGRNGELRVGIRRVSSQKSYTPHCYLPSGKTTDLFTDVLATASHAVSTHTLFTVFYRPSGRSQFIVGKNKYMECVKKLWSLGLRISMRFEGKDHTQTRCTGSIIGVGDVSTSWTDSKWRCLKVKWDDLSTTIRPLRVSPWEIDLVDPLISSQQYWIQDVGQPNWTSIHQMCQDCQQWVPNAAQPSYQQQTNDIPMGPLLSNEDNWFQYMLNDQSDLQIPGHDEAVQLDDLGQIFSRAENGGLSTIVCSQFPTVSPPIHFSELHGERVSENSEESVQTRKRKTIASVGDAESGNDDRQVKCRIEHSNSDGTTHYSSASEGETCTEKCSQDVEGADDRGFIYRVWDRIFGPLVHQLRNYVAK